MAAIVETLDTRKPDAGLRSAARSEDHHGMPRGNDGEPATIIFDNQRPNTPPKSKSKGSGIAG